MCAAAQSRLALTLARALVLPQVLWDAKDVDWKSFDAVLVRSTWDYQDRLPEFLAAMKQIERYAGNRECRDARSVPLTKDDAWTVRRCS